MGEAGHYSPALIDPIVAEQDRRARPFGFMSGLPVHLRDPVRSRDLPGWVGRAPFERASIFHSVDASLCTNRLGVQSGGAPQYAGV